jgi:hypothetical protein
MDRLMKLRSLICAGLLSTACALVRASGQAPGIEELHRLDRLAEFKESLKIGCASSYDRTGGNDDGFSGKYSFLRREPQGLILADLNGPGVIYRVWTPTPTDDVLEFLLDGETTPRIEVKFRDLFLGRHPSFPRPLSGFGAGGYYCYVPIPFSRSCVVRIRADRAQFYQINYALYGPDQNITSFGGASQPAYGEHLEKALTLFSKAGADISTFTAPPGSKLRSAYCPVSLPPRSSRTIFQSKKGGRIAGLRFSPAEAMAGKARDLVLRISFDGGQPAVLCPLGDFFGYAWGRPATRGLLAGTTSGGTNYCYFPMPFDRRATLEILSERSAPVAFNAEILHTDIPRRPNEGRFHALWRRENPTTVGEPYTILRAAGRGHLVGVLLQAQGYESGKTLFFEGDDQTTLDGDLAIHGTGSEDFFNGGWYDVPDRWEKRISLPLSGCLDYAKHLGRTGAYRFLIGDAYPFRRSILQTIEHAGEKNSIPTDYCSVAFFYSDRTSPASLPPLTERAVVDPREIVFPAWWQTPIHAWSFERASLSRKQTKMGGEEVRYLSLEATGDDWFGSHFYSPVCDLPSAGTYSVYLEVLKGPGQGVIQLFQNENPAGEKVDLYSETPVRSAREFLGKLPLAEGPNNLMFKLVGKNGKSSGLGLDLIQIVCVREPGE